MPQPIAVVAADCHLDHLIWRSRPEIRGDSFYAFRQLTEKAISLKLPLILAGDVVETLPADSPNSDTVYVLNRALQSMRNAGLMVYSTRGQHDLAETDWLYACGGYPSPTYRDVVQLAGKSFAFIPWMPPSMLREVMPSVSSDVVVCHQVWQELMGGKSAEGRLADFRNVSMVISGDYHRRVTKYVRRKKGDLLYVLSPGATHMRKINEPSTHCAAILHSDLSIKWVKLKSRQVLRASVDSEAAVETVLRTLPAAVEQASQDGQRKALPSELITPLLIVSDTSDLIGVEPRLREAVGDRAHLFYSSRGKLFDVENEFTPTGCEHYSLNEFIRAEVGPDEVVSELLQSLFDPEKKVAETLKAYSERFLGVEIRSEST